MGERKREKEARRASKQEEIVTFDENENVTQKDDHEFIRCIIDPMESASQGNLSLLT
jgi:hypothetical protein